MNEYLSESLVTEHNQIVAALFYHVLVDVSSVCALCMHAGFPEVAHSSNLLFCGQSFIKIITINLLLINCLFFDLKASMGACLSDL